MVAVDAGHAAGYAAQHFVGDGIGLAGNGLCGVAHGAAPQDGFVVLAHFRHVGHVHHHLIHAHPPQHRAGLAVDLHHALAAAQKPGVAVGIAGAKGGYLGGLFGGKAAAVAGALAGLHLLDHAHHGLEGHHRLKAPKAYLVAGVVAVQDDAGARHAALPGQALRPVRVQHDASRVIAVHKGRLPTGGFQGVEGNVLRPALQIIKTVPGITCVSGAMLLLTHAPEYGNNGVLVMGDVAVTPMPDANQLAQIAVCTAQTAKAVAGIDPRVALLSFSTKGSAKHEVVDKVVEALSIAKEMAPDLKIDGELQADAALVPHIGASKAPGSEIAGKANVLVVPCLEVGNISYKLVERLGHATAIGPILQGIARPVNDLSRGCSIDDVYKMIAITANQAIAAKANN